MTKSLLIPSSDHKDIVDERRKALHALGFEVKFRWQIASDGYAIINPKEAYLPIIGALQRRGQNDVFGWVSYRDWGGILKMFVICPGLRHVTSVGVDKTDVDGGDELVLYGGLRPGTSVSHTVSSPGK